MHTPSPYQIFICCYFIDSEKIIWQNLQDRDLKLCLGVCAVAHSNSVAMTIAYGLWQRLQFWTNYQYKDPKWGLAHWGYHYWTSCFSCLMDCRLQVGYNYLRVQVLQTNPGDFVGLVLRAGPVHNSASAPWLATATAAGIRHHHHHQHHYHHHHYHHHQYHHHYQYNNPHVIIVKLFPD